MNWRRAKPTKPGWYWVQKPREWETIIEFWCTDQGVQPRQGGHTSDWQWFAGPIEEPPRKTTVDHMVPNFAAFGHGPYTREFYEKNKRNRTAKRAQSSQR